MHSKRFINKKNNLIRISRCDTLWNLYFVKRFERNFSLCILSLKNWKVKKYWGFSINWIFPILGYFWRITKCIMLDAVFWIQTGFITSWWFGKFAAKIAFWRNCRFRWGWVFQTLLRWRPLTYRNQSINLHRKINGPVFIW